ncbi:MAG: TonB-dependent receptor [Opitutae bacterium]|nr:TonB-dependent receptor [Opitutae bacterium]
MIPQSTSTSHADRPRRWTRALAALLALPGLLLAQNNSAPEEETFKLDKFVVTGSAIPTAEGETFSPVTIYAPAEMARLGAATPIEVVRHLPGYTGSVATEQRTNGGTGSSGVNLRGLAGTLTLLDGKKTQSYQNFNLIPQIAIKRIEVVKDGAGSIYGSDALSGVFNVMLTDRYEGAKADFYYGNTTDKDAGVIRASAIAGYTLGKTNVVVAVESYSRNALHGIDREPSDQADQRFRGGVNGGSPSFSGRATARVGSATAPVQDLVLAPGKTIGLSAADFIPMDTNSATSNQMLNFRRFTPSIPEQKRRNLYARLNQKLFNEQVEFYAYLLYAHDEFLNGLAPSPMPTGGSAGTALRTAARLSPHIPVGFFIADNATSPGALTNGTVPFRTITLGPRLQTNIRDSYEAHGGFNGHFGQDWNWSLNYIYDAFARDVDQSGAPSRAALVQRILSGAYNPWALDDVAGVGPTGVAFDNRKALAESAAKGRTDINSQNRGFDFSANGSAFSLPSGDVKLGFGADYYRVDLANLPEPIFFTGDLLGLNGSNPSISRAYGTGAFAALHVPIVGEHQKIPLVRSLKLQLEGRYDYQTVEGFQNGTTGAQIGRSFTAHNPKLGLQWQPTDELLVRGTWGTGFRLPSLSQLFGAPGTSFPSLVDPLGFAIPNQTQITTGGNAQLSPEESTTYSAGFVWSPKKIHGLSVTVDYYYGTINGLVGEGSQFILNVNAAGQGSGFVRGNAATINPNAPFANLIVRDPVTGSVTTINSTQFNISARETTGVEWAVTYVWPRGDWGKFTTKAEWNTALTWTLTPNPGAPKQSFLGTFIDVQQNAISPGSIPRHKGYFSLLWEKGSWAAVVTANHISKLQDNPAFTQGNAIRYIEPWTTLDVQVQHDFTGGAGWRKWLADTTLRLGAANVTDESAPFAAGAFNDSYDVTTHSNRGRFVYAQLTKKF